MKSRGGDPRWIDSDVRLGNAESDLSKSKSNTIIFRSRCHNQILVNIEIKYWIVQVM